MCNQYWYNKNGLPTGPDETDMKKLHTEALCRGFAVDSKRFAGSNLRRDAKLRDQRKDAVAVSSSVLEPPWQGSHDRILKKKLGMLSSLLWLSKSCKIKQSHLLLQATLGVQC